MRLYAIQINQVHISRIPLKNSYSLVTAYVIDKRRNPESDIESLMFQVEVTAYSSDGRSIFIAENICRELLAADEFYFEQRPILGRGRGCAATWGEPVNGRARHAKFDFIPYEFPASAQP